MAIERGYMPGAIVKKTTKKYVAPAGRPFDLWAVVEHIADGGANTWQYLQTGAQKSSSTFFVTKRGEIYQLASIFERTWANGLDYENGHYIDPQGAIVDPPWWRLHAYPGIDPNKVTVSIEHEGWSTEERTPAMIAADVKILVFIHQETGLIYEPGKTLIRHSEISPKNRANCPGPHFDMQALADMANTAAGVDSLTVKWLPGPNNTKRLCGTGFYGYYQEAGALRTFGLALSNEYKRLDRRGTLVSIMEFERAWMKYDVDEKPWSVRTVLIDEIDWMRANR